MSGHAARIQDEQESYLSKYMMAALHRAATALSINITTDESCHCTFQHDGERLTVDVMTWLKDKRVNPMELDRLAGKLVADLHADSFEVVTDALYYETGVTPGRNPNYPDGQPNKIRIYLTGNVQDITSHAKTTALGRDLEQQWEKGGGN